MAAPSRPDMTSAPPSAAEPGPATFIASISPPPPSITASSLTAMCTAGARWLACATSSAQRRAVLAAAMAYVDAALDRWSPPGDGDLVRAMAAGLLGLEGAGRGDYHVINACWRGLTRMVATAGDTALSVDAADAGATVCTPASFTLSAMCGVLFDRLTAALGALLPTSPPPPPGGAASFDGVAAVHGWTAAGRWRSSWQAAVCVSGCVVDVAPARRGVSQACLDAAVAGTGAVINPCLLDERAMQDGVRLVRFYCVQLKRVVAAAPTLLLHPALQPRMLAIAHVTRLMAGSAMYPMRLNKEGTAPGVAGGEGGVAHPTGMNGGHGEGVSWPVPWAWAAEIREHVLPAVTSLVVRTLFHAPGRGDGGVAMVCGLVGHVGGAASLTASAPATSAALTPPPLTQLGWYDALLTQCLSSIALPGGASLMRERVAAETGWSPHPPTAWFWLALLLSPPFTHTQGRLMAAAWPALYDSHHRLLQRVLSARVAGEGGGGMEEHGVRDTLLHHDSWGQVVWGGQGASTASPPVEVVEVTFPALFACPVRTLASAWAYGAVALCRRAVRAGGDGVGMVVESWLSSLLGAVEGASPAIPAGVVHTLTLACVLADATIPGIAAAVVEGMAAIATDPLASPAHFDAMADALAAVAATRMVPVDGVVTAIVSAVGEVVVGGGKDSVQSARAWQLALCHHRTAARLAQLLSRCTGVQDACASPCHPASPTLPSLLSPLATALRAALATVAAAPPPHDLSHVHALVRLQQATWRWMGEGGVAPLPRGITTLVVGGCHTAASAALAATLLRHTPAPPSPATVHALQQGVDAWLALEGMEQEAWHRDSKRRRVEGAEVGGHGAGWPRSPHWPVALSVVALQTCVAAASGGGVPPWPALADVVRRLMVALVMMGAHCTGRAGVRWREAAYALFFELTRRKDIPYDFMRSIMPDAVRDLFRALLSKQWIRQGGGEDGRGGDGYVAGVVDEAGGGAPIRLSMVLGPVTPPGSLGWTEWSQRWDAVGGLRTGAGASKLVPV